MRPISEVLRLAAHGRSQREISIGTGLAKTTVNRYLGRAGRGGGPAALAARLVLAGELRGELRAGRPEPDREAVHRELKRRNHHVTLQLLWMEYREQHPRRSTFALPAASTAASFSASPKLAGCGPTTTCS
jgi:transposase